ncbi:MAG: glycosyltransferase [Candidatus Nezhaarchaeales archaeon]
MKRHSQHLDTSILVCEIGPFESEGGVSRSVLVITLLFRLLGFRVKLIPLSKQQLLRPAYLHGCNVIHVHSQLLFEYIMILFKVPRSIKILTLHGWVLEEQIIYLRYMYDVPLVKRIISTFFVFISWLINKLIFIPFTVHIVTAVSKITAEKNKVNAIKTINPFIEYYIRKQIKECNELNKSNNEIWITSYVSIGGGKILSIPRIVKVAVILNKLLENKGKKVVLHIFGKDIPKWLEELYLEYDPAVKIMHYRRDYICYLKNSDLFIAGYTMPELGHAIIEAISLGVPIAKYSEDPADEEIIDGFNGIVAQNDSDMVRKLYEYIMSINEKRAVLAKNAKITILRKRLINYNYVKVIWYTILKHCLKTINKST